MHGIRQFLDIGSGLPAGRDTHEVAQAIAPESRVFYADNDPMALAHARALLASSPEGALGYLDADIRDTATILTRAGQVLDFTQPAAVLLLAVLDHLPEVDEIRQILTRLLAAVPPGSFLAISHTASDIYSAEMAEMIRRLNEHLGEGSYAARPRAAVARFFDGLDLLAPGVVRVTQWHPQSELEPAMKAALWGGVARKAASPGRG